MDNDTILRTIVSQVYICKAQLETVSLLCDEMLKETNSECKHPINQRNNLTVMGGPDHWNCLICGKEFFNGNEIDENMEVIEP
jgi:hypothetical protein